MVVVILVSKKIGAIRNCLLVIFHQNLGVVEGDRDENGRFCDDEKCKWRSITEEVDCGCGRGKKIYASNAPMQKIQHTKYTLDNNIKIR